MKYIAFYLPQYHTIPENDKWWGKGFTEWQRVRNTEPLFTGHNQPREPFDYYDLSDVKTMIKQSEMAKRYGIHGFCYYHYWFNGKKLLETPLENMLSCKEVDIPFCLSWANESWTRAWEGKSKEFLIRQEYGNESDWHKHLEYLVSYFKDNRYVKIDDKPILIIYRTEQFPHFERMFEFWDREIKKLGFEGIFIIETLSKYQKSPKCKNSNGVLEFEPMFTIGSNNVITTLLKKYSRKLLQFIYSTSYKEYDYDKVWNKIINRDHLYRGKKYFRGAFTDWDNTPRFGNKSISFKNVTPGKFAYYLSELSNRTSSEFIFINAWNEWAEGAHLEPDRKNGEKFLEAIKNVIESL